MTFAEAKAQIAAKFQIFDPNWTTISLPELEECSFEVGEHARVELSTLFRKLSGMFTQSEQRKGNWEFIQVVSIDIAARLAGVDLTPFRQVINPFADLMDDEEHDYVIPFMFPLPDDITPDNGNIDLVLKLDPDGPKAVAAATGQLPQ